MIPDADQAIPIGPSTAVAGRPQDDQAPAAQGILPTYERELDDDDPLFGQSTVLHVRYDPSKVSDQFVVSVLDGPDAGKQWVLDGACPSRSLVGSSPACEVRLNDPTVSRRHAAFELEGDRLRISDLSSKNETVVHGMTVIDAYLRGGERIELGATVLSVERRRGTPPKLPSDVRFGRTVGASTEMRRLYPLCDRLASADIPIIIEGETGTGKEVLAHSLHEGGPRAGRPFVIFDCTTAPATLLESELFGHRKGAFTGAATDRVGLFQEAHGGTLFIDEIGDLHIALQAKLLRVIDSSQYRRVGSNDYHQADVRIIAATRRDLDREVTAGRFRDDLYHRLAVGRIELPPLRKRRGDVWALCRHFAAEMGQDLEALPPELLSRWDRETWPGNVRELKNAVARHLVLGDLALGPALEDVADDETGDLVARILAERLPLQDARDKLNREFSRLYLRQALEDSGGNVTHAANASGISRRYLQILKAKLGE
ncbi:MAG: sigma 54-dependent Fis family transcriptional regulator [Deltaproteobacteria bacterium]|jgi:DNA-binding NtrC family response regulator|nr:sigma 54-dependent Fis family transcriptional regulator [Deltaproteobacteria bacterium]MBW2533379.1 sigma 54-dependent Fis family transcriptional regulator [Deltaproteobacteria bacterium]